MSGHHTFLGCGAKERLLYRWRHRVDDGDLRRADHVDNWLWESAQNDIYYSFLEGDKVVDVNDVRNDDSQDSSSKSAQDGEKIGPG